MTSPRHPRQTHPPEWPSLLAGWLWRALTTRSGLPEAPARTLPPATLYGYEIYTPPPSALRYTVERWSHEDEQSNREAGETYAPTYCVACYSMQGGYYIGEYIVDDSLSADTYHIRCVPATMRARAWLGTLVCTLWAVLCIDTLHNRLLQ